MKDKMNQLFKDKLVLVMLVLGLLTIVAAAGAVKLRTGDKLNEANPYLEMPENGGVLAENDAAAQPGVQEVKPSETKARPAGSSDASYSSSDKKEPAKTKEEGKTKEVGTSKAKALTLNFTDSSKLAWPVMGNIILDYSMDSTIYFPTLEQYKCNPAIIIQSDVSAPVNAPANARVLETGSNEEIGNYVVLDLGNDYTVVCGQLKDIQVVKDEYIHQGSLLGYVSDPTKYYSIEGNNLFLEMKHGTQPVDALDFLE